MDGLRSTSRLGSSGSGRWCDGRPAVRNSWVALPETLNVFWLRLALLCRRRLHDSGFEPIEGSFVDSRSALYCAIGESVAGPGGYYGSDLDSLSDCFSGGFGPVPPFSLTWLDAKLSKAKLEAATPGYFDGVLELFAEKGVDVILK
ncbi:MAG: barstar family protein [Myxococcota bacterium]